MRCRWVLLGIVLCLWPALSFGQQLQSQPVHTFQSAATATGNGESLAVQGWATVGLQVVISDTATITFEATTDGSNWVSRTCVSIASTSAALVTTASASGLFSCDVAGMSSFRARISSYTGGTVTVKGLATLAKKGGGGGGSTGTASAVTSSGTLPAACTIGDVYVDNDLVALYLCTATDTWTAVLTSETQTLQLAFAQGKAITGANSEANCFRAGTSTNYYCIYSDAGTGLYVKPEPLADTTLRAWTNFNLVFRDEESAAAIETIDPDAASTLAMWTYGTAYRPKKSIWFDAGSISTNSTATDGQRCEAPAEVTLNSGPITWTIICDDHDSASMYGKVRMPDAWDGGTLTFTHVYLQTAADTSALNGDIAAQCRGNGEAPSSTWGTEVAIDDAGVTGSNQNDETTSAAVTPAGTCAAGDMLYWRYQLDATGTTTAVATLHHLGFKMEYSITSRSD
jgi:hypothetical protein